MRIVLYQAADCAPETEYLHWINTVHTCACLQSAVSAASIRRNRHYGAHLQLNTTHWRASALARSFVVSVLPVPAGL
jgi:hypothetical protein